MIISNDKCKFNTKLVRMYNADTEETRTSTVHTCLSNQYTNFVSTVDTFASIATFIQFYEVNILFILLDQLNNSLILKPQRGRNS